MQAPRQVLRDVILALAYIVGGIVLLSKAEVNLTGVIATSAVITAAIASSAVATGPMTKAPRDVSSSAIDMPTK